MIFYYSFIVLITLLYSWLLWKLDRYEHEPIKLLVAAFLWGAIPAIIFSGILEVVFAVPLKHWLSPGLQDLALGSFLAPVVEESIKGLALLGLFLWAYWEFDDPMDGILYGGLVGFGFAMVEDFAYVSGASDPLLVTLLRTIPFGLNHAFFTGITGAALGFARLKKGKWRSVLPIVGLLLAMTFHALHNLGMTVSRVTVAGFFFGLFTDWIGILWLLVVVLISLKQERGWIREYLKDEVGETLSESDFEHITSRKKLKKWLNGDSAKESKLRKKLYDLSVNLAFKKAELDKDITNRQDTELHKQIGKLKEEISDIQRQLSQSAEEEA